MPTPRHVAILRGLIAVTLLTVTAACGGAGATGEAGGTVKLAINPAQLQYLPIMLAADKGYFRAAGADVEIVTYQGSANNQIPVLARGDIDLSPAVSGPSLFNQYTQGFRIKLLANLTLPRKGFRDGVVMVVRKDLWDSGKMRTLQDLVGKKVEGSAEGNPADFLIRQALIGQGIKPEDVQLSHRARTPSDSVEFLRQRVVDAAVMSEPSATQAEAQGAGVRWLGYTTIIPWYQETFLAASEKFATTRAEDARKVMTAYLRAVQDINAANGKWNQELLGVATKWTKQKPEVLTGMGGLMYWSPDGRIDGNGIDRVQQFWLGQKLVTRQVAVARLVDRTILDQAAAKGGQQ
jgi:NitT/TauT family transport system substrate-binding protein